MPYDVPPPRSTPSWEACKNALPAKFWALMGA
jgi:hypothetical protein